MFVPLFSTRNRSLERRKGGGGGKSGGSSSSGSSSSGSSSSGSSSSGSSSGSSSSGSSSSGSSSSGSSGVKGSSSSSSGSKPSFPVSNTGTKSSSGTTTPLNAVPYGGGGGTVATIPAGALFAGRQQGGGTRAQIFGTRTYGSGYGAPSRGVNGLGFPFFFWPVVWGGGLGYGSAYLHDNEYGDVNNSSRPGGALVQVPIQPSPATETYHVISDNSTVASLIDSISAACTVGNAPLTAVAVTGATTDPRPEQAVQYFRASSVVLTLDGYNDTAALADTPGPDTPLPTTINTTFLDCLNNTIAQSVPLIDNGALALRAPSLLVLAWAALLVKGLL